MNQKKLLLLGISGLMFFPTLIFAQTIKTTTTQNMKNTVTVANSCVINSTDSVDFGNYIPSSLSDLTSQGQISLTCTKGAVATVTPNSGGSSMSGSSGSLNYGLYVDSGFTKKWGSSSFSFTNIDFSQNQYGFIWDHFAFNGSGASSSFAACQSAANGGVFEYVSGACYYGLDPSNNQPYPNSYGQLNSNVGLNIDGNTIFSGSQGILYATSQQASQISGKTYSIQTVEKTGTATLTGQSTSYAVPINLTYYAKLPAGQDVAPGTYVDTVVVQVSF